MRCVRVFLCVRACACVRVNKLMLFFSLIHFLLKYLSDFRNMECGGHAIVFCVLCRAAGIPARRLFWPYIENHPSGHPHSSRCIHLIIHTSIRHPNGHVITSRIIHQVIHTHPSDHHTSAIHPTHPIVLHGMKFGSHEIAEFYHHEFGWFPVDATR